MVAYSTCWIVPKGTDTNGFAVTTKKEFPDIVIIPFPLGETFDDCWKEKFPGWKAQLEKEFANVDS